MNSSQPYIQNHSGREASVNASSCPQNYQSGCPCKNIRNDRNTVMNKIYELGFAMTETMLYLDTHPDDDEAISYYADLKEQYILSMNKYADYYGPLDMTHMVNDNYWMWVSTPFPWEEEGM